MLREFKGDIKRYFTLEELQAGITVWKVFKRVLQNETLWAIFMYRTGRWIHTGLGVPFLRSLLKILYAFPSSALEILLGIHINLGADIGKGLYIGHYGGIWIGPIKMGEHCSISQEVTIGIGKARDHRGLPQIGNRVWIGPGAKIFGDIRIGAGVSIGANAVVSKTVPDNAVMVGNPARVVGYSENDSLLDLSDTDKGLFASSGRRSSGNE